MHFSKLITFIRNGLITNKEKIVVPLSKKVLPFLEVLYKENYIRGFKKISSKEIEIHFCFTYQRNRILSFKSISKPSRAIYFSLQDLWKFEKSLLTIILSTSQGVITHNSALKKSCGGKVLCILL
jgi:small subunit ribosomal protein S8